MRVRTRPDLRYITMRRKTGGNAHVAVYSVDEQAVNLLHVFHKRPGLGEPAGR